MNKLRVVLFALTGFGNTVLKALLDDERVKVEAVFTVKYDNPFPYYVEQHLDAFCADRSVNCYHGLKVSSGEGFDLLCQYRPDLIMMATFKQILKENVINLPKFGVVNFHPSLLPAYRGPCPTNAALLNDEKSTGITDHYVTENVDEGNILLQKSIAIHRDDTDGQLRRRLANLAGLMVPELLDLFDSPERPLGSSQDSTSVSFAPKPTQEDGFLELDSDIETIRRKMRAYNPLPGTSILVGDKRMKVDRFELINDIRPDGVYESAKAVDIINNSSGIRLYKAD